MNTFIRKISYWHFVALSFLLPLVSSAQIAKDNANTDLHKFGGDIVEFINDVLVPFVFAVCLMLFIYGVYLFFFLGRAEDDNLKNGRQYMIWAVLAFVLMVSVWGIVNLIAGGLGTDKSILDRSLIPDETFKN